MTAAIASGFTPSSHNWTQTFNVAASKPVSSILEISIKVSIVSDKGFAEESVAIACLGVDVSLMLRKCNNERVNARCKHTNKLSLGYHKLVHVELETEKPMGSASAQPRRFFRRSALYMRAFFSLHQTETLCCE